MDGLSKYFFDNVKLNRI